MPLLQVEQLSWSTATKAIIENINFTVTEGEVVGIIGPNGAGKSTILKCIHQAYRANSGNILFNHRSMATWSKRQVAQQIAVVSQLSDSTFNLSVIDIVQMGLTPHKKIFELTNDRDRHRIELALQKVNLIDQQTQLFNTLSGGEQQRCLIARALVQQPTLLLLDEPTNHLDIYYQHQILSLVKQLNISLLITIHDLNLAAQYCDKLVLIDQGQQVAFDKPEKVLTPAILSKVFKLECQVERHRLTNCLNIVFHAETSATTSCRGNDENNP